MKKVLLVISFLMMFVLVGCGKYDDADILKDLSSTINKSNGYYVEGVMEIFNGEDRYDYDVKVSYQKDDKYKVSLLNKSNNHEQIILKNDEGVYVLTPSLNKTFKFQSQWPYNNSQVYLLGSILKDLDSDDEKTFEETEKYYVFRTGVNYPNNRDLASQVIYLDKNLNFKEIHVLNSENNPQIKMKFNSVDMKATFDETYFALNEALESAVLTEVISPVMAIDEIIYPMYIPENTYLTGQDKLGLDYGERMILTFDGDNPFMLVQETSNIYDNMEIIPMYGEPEMLLDTIGVVGTDSITWDSSGISYYLVSNALSKDVLYEIASSISVMPVSK